MMIRQALVSDIPAMLQLLARIVPVMHAEGNFQWDSTYPNRQVFEEDIRSGQLWVAVLDSQIAGFAAITTDQEPEYAQVGWDPSELAIVTHRLAVDLQFRGRGVGKALLLRAEEEAVRRRIRVLRIDTNTNNAATNILFPALGYHFSGEIGLGFRPGLRFNCYEKRLAGDS
ncbi:MAG TPA: GNAT family N-acetyltransferase [Sphingobacteriaceae bacterium]